MRLNTTTLFYKLIKLIAPDSVYDVGSMDGSDALRFRKILPTTRIVAFEANPVLSEAMKKDRSLKNKHVEIQKTAVSNKNGLLSFYLEHVWGDGGDNWRLGTSSLYRRMDGSFGTREIKVPAVRLDTFIRVQDRSAKSIALWIDVEGTAFEVLEGIRNSYERICLIHVEVEKRRLWIGEKLEADVEKLMSGMGFVKLAEGFNYPQHDVVFVNGDYFKQNQVRVVFTIVYVLILSYLEFVMDLISLKDKGSVTKSFTHEE